MQQLVVEAPPAPRTWSAAAVAAALTACATVAFFSTADLAQQVVYHCISLASAGAVCCGVRLHRPAHPRPWHVLACGLVVMTAADVAGDGLRAGVPLPTWLPIVLYALAWSLLVWAVRCLARIGVPDGDRDAILDAGAVVVALALVLWGVVLDPALREPAAQAASPVAVSAFPLAQAALLALYLRLLFAGGARVVASWILCVGGGVCGLIGSTAYVVLVASGDYHQAAWNNLFWILAYAAPGIAALVPDMRRLTVPVQAGSDVSMARWTVLAGALVATTATTSFTATRMSAALVFASALPVPLIVLWRLRRVLLSRQAAVHRAQHEAARNALVAQLAGEAVIGEIGAVRETACWALAQELQCPVRLVTPDTVSAPGVIAVRVGLVPDVSHVLEVHLPPGRSWSASDDSVVRSVANVLGAAEARHRSEQRVRWAAGHDALTDLLNRGSFMTALTDAVAAAPPGQVTILFLDLDGFKQVNDSYGHTAGDAVLVTTARRLRAACRDGDVVARLGGDEFVMLLRRSEDAAAAGGRLATRVREALTLPISTPVGEVRVGVSIGIASSREHDLPDELLRRADERMYEAKHWLPRPRRA